MADSSVDSKIVFFGAASVGKTCVICRAVSNEFDPEMPNTIPQSCCTAKQVELPTGVSVNLQVWDTAGQERFRTLAPMCSRGAVAAILVFSIVDDASLPAVQDWAQEIRSQTDNMPVLFIVGNKMDLTDDRTVEVAQAEAVAKQLGGQYCEVSAKSGQGIEELFVRIAEESVKRIRGPAAAPRQPAASTSSRTARHRRARRRALLSINRVHLSTQNW
jgi:small GTP-binding protein